MGRPLAMVEALEALDHIMVMLSKQIKESDNPVDAARAVKDRLMPLVEARMDYFPEQKPLDYRCDCTRGHTIRDTQDYAKPCVSAPTVYDDAMDSEPMSMGKPGSGGVVDMEGVMRPNS